MDPGPIPTVRKAEVGVLSSSCPSPSLPFRCGACLPQTRCPRGGQVECPRLMPPAWWCPGLSRPSSPAHLLCVHVRAKSSLEPLRRLRRQHRQAISLMNRIRTQNSLSLSPPQLAGPGPGMAFWGLAHRTRGFCTLNQC